MAPWKAGTIFLSPLAGLFMHIISRPLYEAALSINESTEYEPGNADHDAILAAGIARLNGPLIELTHKGEEVVRLE
jgi:hypothetical protein